MSVTVYRPLSGRIEVSGMRAPREGEPSNREWFKDETGKAIRPWWIAGPKGWDGHWEIARQHFLTVARALAGRFGQVELVMDFNEHERCDRRCRDARGDDCTCTCMGINHRGGVYAGWVDVGETTLIRSAGVKRSTSTLTRAQVRRGF
jgi:hypothetical protein